MRYFKIFLSVLAVYLGILNSSSERQVFKFQQNDYKIKFERVEMHDPNEKYFKYVKIVTFKYNRIAPIVNATFQFKVALGNNLQVVVQVYKFLSNEYRTFPIHFEVNICDALDKNLMGLQKSFTCGNFTGCPVKKNFAYHLCNWSIDESQFPPLIPDGKYMADLNGRYFGEHVGTARLYVTVFRPVPIP